MLYLIYALSQLASTSLVSECGALTYRNFNFYLNYVAFRLLLDKLYCAPPDQGHVLMTVFRKRKSPMVYQPFLASRRIAVDPPPGRNRKL